MLKDPSQVDDVSWKYRWSKNNWTRPNGLKRTGLEESTDAEEMNTDSQGGNRSIQVWKEVDGVLSGTWTTGNSEVLWKLQSDGDPHRLISRTLVLPRLYDQKQGVRKTEFCDTWNAILPSFLDNHNLPQWWCCYEASRHAETRSAPSAHTTTRCHWSTKTSCQLSICWMSRLHRYRMLRWCSNYGICVEVRCSIVRYTTHKATSMVIEKSFDDEGNT